MTVSTLPGKSTSVQTPLLPIGRIIDISLELDPKTFKMKVLPGFQKDAQFELEVIKPYDASEGDGQVVRAVRMRLHAGSHIDAPAHQMPTGKMIHELPLEKFIGDAIVADFRDKVPGGVITAEDMESRIGSDFQRGDRVLLRTDVNKTYLQTDLKSWAAKSVALTPSARRWCIERGATLVGFDCDHGKRQPGETERQSKILPDAEVYTLPYLNNLDQITKKRVTLICFPLAILGVEASPVRAIVIES